MNPQRELDDVFDVAIVGGGLVGCALGVAMAMSNRRIVLLEAAPPRDAPAAWDERCIALNAGSQRILDALGLWDAIAVEAEPITSTHISEKGRFGATRFDAKDAELAALGYNTPLRRIDSALWDAVGKSAVEVLRPAQVDSVEVHRRYVTVGLADGRTALRARLVVAADGAHSGVRSLLGLPHREHDYGQQAIVTAVRPQHRHAGVAYERFLPTGPLAVLPKPDDADGHACSLVWTLPSREAEQALQWDEQAFLSNAMDAFGERLGRFLTLGRRSAYPLFQVMADTRVTERTVLIGNAAQSLHPVAAQGFNLGLRDAWALAHCIDDAPDPGSQAMLKAFEQLRFEDRSQTAGFTDQLVRLFSNSLPGVRGLRHLGLMFLDFDSPARSRILSQNLGLRGVRGDRAPS